MKVIHPADAQPSEMALHTPVETDDDLDRILAWIKWLASRRQTVETALTQTINLLKATARDDLHVELNGQSYSFDEVEAVLMQQVSEYALEHRERLFAKKRTYPLPHGNVMLRKQRDAIKPTGELTEEEVLELVGTDPRFVRIARALDRQHIMAQFTRGELNAQQLDDVGLQLVPGEDEVKVG